MGLTNLLADLGLVEEVSAHMRRKKPLLLSRKKIMRRAYKQGVEKCLKIADYYANLGDLDRSEGTVKDFLGTAEEYAYQGCVPYPKNRAREILRSAYQSLIDKANHFIETFSAPEFSRTEEEKESYKKLVRSRYFPLITKYEEKLRQLDRKGRSIEESTQNDTPQIDIEKSLPRY